jgi:hypothetical protein
MHIHTDVLDNNLRTVIVKIAAVANPLSGGSLNVSF